MKTKFKLLSLSASLLACGLGMSGNAQANAYALSTNYVKDGFLNITSGQLSFGTPSSVSSSSATLNGVGQSGSSVTPPPDAPVSNGTGSVPLRGNEWTFASPGGNIYYNANGQGDTVGGTRSLFGPLPTNYSNGDARVVSEQSITGTPVVARNVAESNIATRGFGDADGRNSSSTLLTAPLSCNTSSCSFGFSFFADPYIRVLLDAAAGAGSVARGVLSVSLTLRKTGDLVDTFAWAPNGVVGNGIVGGTEQADAENLNLTVTQLTPGSTVHSGPYAADVFGRYAATTNPFGGGSYVLSLSMIEKTDVTRNVVPEPGSLALLGLSLAGLAFMRRRKQA